jgi:hypothetical protein
MLLTDFVRIVNAANNFKIKDNFEFISFDDITHEMGGLKDEPESIEIWAAVKIFYDGKLPDSYKALNLIIGDWVEKNNTELSKVLHFELKDHFKEKYKDSNTEDLEKLDNSAIWLDQLDYMPSQVENKKALIIEIELVLHAEPIEE